MTEILIVTERLVRATSIDAFRHSQGEKIGKFRYGMPYWVRLTNGALWFDYLARHSKLADLEAQLQAEQLWIRESDWKEAQHA